MVSGTAEIVAAALFGRLAEDDVESMVADGLVLRKKVLDLPYETAFAGRDVGGMIC